MAAFYSATILDFLSHAPVEIIGRLSSSYQHTDLKKRQIKAWEKEIKILKEVGHQLFEKLPNSSTWTLLLEYPIPRRRKRLDAVLLADDVIVCLEFKTEDAAHSLSARRQVEEYALDLRDFHAESLGRKIVPIVVVPAALSIERTPELHETELVRSVQCANVGDLSEILVREFYKARGSSATPIDGFSWDHSVYRPIPTIIEAAEALYAGIDVEEISHSYAEATNLTVTSTKLIEIIRLAQSQDEKIVCFVTGVPGAGKTLAGLNVVHNPALRSKGAPAGVFLSGNAPLVKIISAAISRDHRRRVQKEGADRTVSTLIQNVHIFIREGLDKPDKPPNDKIVVFDEAQRAWNAEQNRKKNGLDVSEPELMLSILDRNKGWAVLIALVGGGQEINNGEAGLAEWGKTLKVKFPNWKIAVSPKVLGSDASLAGHRLFESNDAIPPNVTSEPSLHLEVSLRASRAKKLTEWVEAALAGEIDKAAVIIKEIDAFPFSFTRSLGLAREFLRNVRGQQRSGLVASSGAVRLRSEGIELSSGFRQGNRDMYVHWFLSQSPDVRSSNQLEVAASEFECQGLELDWVGVCWGGDFTYNCELNGWDYRAFSGKKWGSVKSETDRRYLLNAYRVLLTRARRGMVIWVPQGSASDDTHPARWFDSTAHYLRLCGVPERK